jgi:hypothetical protein
MDAMVKRSKNSRSQSVSERYSIAAGIAGSIEYVVFRLDQNGAGVTHDVRVRLHDLGRVSSSLETLHNLLWNARFQSHIICLGPPGATI